MLWWMLEASLPRGAQGILLLKIGLMACETNVELDKPNIITRRKHCHPQPWGAFSASRLVGPYYYALTGMMCKIVLTLLIDGGAMKPG